jgi:pimeloyl-ACP methyl ester carboxylesterase
MANAQMLSYQGQHHLRRFPNGNAWMQRQQPDGSMPQSALQHPEVRALADAAAVRRTPCGDGDLVWRHWAHPDPAAGTVILCHGGSGSWLHWLRTIPTLRARYNVLAVDLPGLGDSAMPPAPLTPEHAGKWLALGIRELVPPAARAHLVSFSFGSHVATFALAELGAEASERVGDFTICGCAALGLNRGPELKFAKERAGMSAAELREVHAYNLAVLMIRDPSRIDALAIDIQASNVRQARFRSRPFASTDEIKRNLHRVMVPLNAIWGALDQIATPGVEARYAVLREHHPELLTRTVADAGHWVMYEQPAAYNTELLELLAQREAERAAPEAVIA